jgi:hypothetical protein
MNYLKLVLAAVFGLALGTALSRTPAIKGQSNGIAVTVYGGKMTTFTEGSNTWTGGYIQTKGAQVVGFSCIANSDGNPECFAAVTK